MRSEMKIEKSPKTESGRMDMELRIENAKPEDAGQIAAFLKCVRDGMEEPDWFVADEEAYIKELLETGRGFIWKVLCCPSDCLGAVLSVWIPGDSPENLGCDAGLSQSALKLAAHIDSVAVSPQLRGKGLQHRLMELAERRLWQQGFRYLFCTVHPDNRFSRNNMEKCGFYSIKRTKKYGGLPREVMGKKLEKKQ